MRSSPSALLCFALSFLLTSCQQQPTAPEQKAASAPATSGDIVRDTVHRRAVEAVIWGMPAVNSSEVNVASAVAYGKRVRFFGPKAPAGKDSNWVPTDPNGNFEVLFRLYGPQKPFFDKTWKLRDIEHSRP